LAAPHLQMVLEPGRLRILDTGLSRPDREELQDVLLGPDVLDVSRFPRITFHSLAVERRPSGWMVHGELELRGRFYAVPVHVDENRGEYRGSATLRLSDFGMPVNRSNGTFALHDEVVIEFVVIVMP
jgi:polyisoprenoid-binding protein YceI